MSKTMNKKESEDFFSSFELVAEEKELTTEQVVSAFSDAVLAGCKKIYPKEVKVKIDLDKEKKQVRICLLYQVITEDALLEQEKDNLYMLLEDARLIEPKAKVGDIIEKEINLRDFSLGAISIIKSKFADKLLDMRKESLYEYYHSLEDNIISATVIDVGDDHYRLDIGRETTTILPFKNAIPTDKFKKGDKIRVYITKVDFKSKWPKVFVSRVDVGIIRCLFELVIPEIKDKTIEIVSNISREAGDRSKIGVKSNDPKVDPIGACVGEGGSRIREIVNALSGEKIDLFRWSDNERDLIKNALQPAEVIAVTRVNPKDKSALAIVPDDQQSLAIGKGGLNVKLAVNATGWSIDIKSLSQVEEEGIIY